MALLASDPAARRAGWGSLRELNRYQWFVFSVASLAWLADCMDQQLFNLARQSAITDLLGGPAAAKADVKTFATVSTSIFLIGWAIGGLVFGMYGDRLGRVRTLTLTILLYSLFTGLSALSMTVYDFCAYRFLTGLGVGGVFAAAVALLAETMPPTARPFTLGLMQALSAIGNCTAAGLFILLGMLQLDGHLDALKPVTAWRLMFLIGLVPAILVIFIQRRVKEPDAWTHARKAHETGTGQKLGSFAELFGRPDLRRRVLFGLLLAFAGVVGLWGIGFFSIDLQQSIMNATYNAEADTRSLTGPDRDHYIGGQRIIWAGVTSFFLNVGAFIGMTGFSWVTSRIGRRPAFAIALLAAAASTALVFWTMKTRNDIFWMIPLMGICQLALFGGYAIYFPELFPTRLRATGTSFCYNVGRLVAAVGPLALGLLSTQVFAGYGEPYRPAGVVMCSVFLLGLVALPFLPETKDKPLPE